MSRVRVFVGSAESMRELADGEIALTVTSPPYWNAVDYDRYAADPARDWRTRSYARGFTTYDEYLALLRRAFTEVWRVTRPGGFCAVIVGTITLDGAAIPLPYDFVRLMTGIGWRLRQDFVWNKTFSPSRRGGALIRHPHPGNYHPNPVFEHVLVFRKPTGKSAGARGDAPRHRVEIDTLYAREIANNVWHVRPVPPLRIDHPCPFPEEIPHRLITLYSSPGETALDPFVGSGQTLKVARALGRNAVGYDVEPTFAALAQERAEEPYVRGPQVIATYEKIAPGVPLNTHRAPKRRRRGGA